jgi:hypothetical protein
VRSGLTIVVTMEPLRCTVRASRTGAIGSSAR